MGADAAEPVLLLLGDSSYSIYLVHPFAQRVLLLAVIRTVGLAAVSPMLYALGAFFIGIVGGVVCYLVLERPCCSLAGG